MLDENTRPVALGPAKSIRALIHARFQAANGDPDRDRRSIGIVGQRFIVCSTIGAKRYDSRA
jgi:hypothetical protein